MPTLNFLIALIIGFIIGFLVELLMEVLYFRGWRRQVRDERVMQLEADVAARDEQLAHAQMDLDARDVKIADLEGRLARGQERLNALQRDAALQRQRAQAVAEAVDPYQGGAADMGEPAASPNPPARDQDRAVPVENGAVANAAAAGDDAQADSDAAPAEVVDTWHDSEPSSKPESWLD